MSDAEKRSCYAIVLIDDDEVVHFIFNKLMSRLYPQLTTRCFSSAEEVVALLKREVLSADLIVLDVQMPRMNGWNFLYELSHLKYAKPICMLSSSAAIRRFSTFCFKVSNIRQGLR